MGGAIEWQSGQFAQLEVASPPRVLIVDTHVERSTRKLVDMVRQRRQRQTSVVDNIFNAIDSIVDKLKELLNHQDHLYSYTNQKELFEMNQHLLSSLGTSKLKHNTSYNRVISGIQRSFCCYRYAFLYLSLGLLGITHLGTLRDFGF